MSGRARRSSVVARLRSRPSPRCRGGTAAGRAATGLRPPAWRRLGDRVLQRLGSLRDRAKVVAMSVKSWALTPATGATRRRCGPALGRSARAACGCRPGWRLTGARWPKSGGSAWIVMLRSGPRPVSALPKPVRFCCDAIRVWRSKILNTSSIWTGTLVWLDRDRVAVVRGPCSTCRGRAPGTSGRAPSAAARRRSSRPGSLPVFWSSLSVSCAPTVGWSTPFSRRRSSPCR